MQTDPLPTIDWGKPLRWEREAVATGRTIKVFPSICDPFDNEVDPEWRAAFFQLIRDTPHLTWLLLTKRIGNAAKMIAEAQRDDGITRVQDFRTTPLHNVWLGATVVNQEEADRDIPKLLAVPAAKRFVSVEPMLGPVRLTHLPSQDKTCDRDEDPDDECGKCLVFDGLRGMTHCSHESSALLGPKICWDDGRTNGLDWFRSLRDQCAAAGVPLLFKQWGEWLHDSQNAKMTGPISPTGAIKVGTKAAGNHLDGRQHLEFPA